MTSKNLDKVVASKDSIYLIDLSWLMHKGLHAFQQRGIATFTSEEENPVFTPTGHIHNVLRTVETLRRAHPQSAVVVCQDGRPKHRREIDHEYKKARQKPEYNIYNDVEIIREALFIMPGVYWAYNDDRESDDLMFALSRQIHELDPDIRVYIHTGDYDLLQAIDDRTVLFRDMNFRGNYPVIDQNKLETDRTLIQKFRATTPEKLPYFRALCGDQSDGLKGISRMPKKLAHRIAEECESVDDIFRAKPYKESEIKWIERIHEDEEKIRRNYELMRLNPDIEVNLSRTRPNIPRVMERLSYLEMTDYISFLHLIGY